ncbi:MAG TPA: hypothetical protein ENI55_02130 [Alphaproteobacteria bacterium]|nr:hypothetical protein [Alphaproteobacteria bacterium]
MQRIFEDEGRDPAPFSPNPTNSGGTGLFFRRIALRKACDDGITALSAPYPTKKLLPPKPQPE